MLRQGLPDTMINLFKCIKLNFKDILSLIWEFLGPKIKISWVLKEKAKIRAIVEGKQRKVVFFKKIILRENIKISITN